MAIRCSRVFMEYQTFKMPFLTFITPNETSYRGSIWQSIKNVPLKILKNIFTVKGESVGKISNDSFLTLSIINVISGRIHSVGNGICEYRIHIFKTAADFST